ncbi:uncharacterized protein LOC126896994 isoform X2 [Daktulosphaira vitifoliae]|uniref:uncharacterized protein LOC126896994 isoform X2 n=1 Tax=Daktulosphaira vitifoliae TaxID=58002 RepID=UPI0021AA57C7|nr:uncharacterized protein LOC126896994 isoform X2 [Daktulosphaira vitifoliae]
MINNYFNSLNMTSFLSVISISAQICLNTNANPKIQPPDYDTIFDDSFLQVVSSINNDIKSLVCGKNKKYINHSLLTYDDIMLLSKSFKDDYECRQKKESSLNKLKKELESLECFHTFLCFQILEGLKNDVRIKDLNPNHTFKINYQHVGYYIVRMISFFIYGKFVVNPWQYDFAMNIFNVTKLQQQKKDTLDISLNYLDDSKLLYSMNKFCDNCKNNNEYIKSMISFTFNTYKRESRHFLNQENLKKYVKKIYSMINISCVIEMTNISHDFIYQAVNKEEVAMNEEYENKKNYFLQSLKISRSDIETLERNSIYYNNNDWFQKERMKRLSASHFHRACKFKQTSCKEAILKDVMRIPSEKSEVTVTEDNISTTAKYGKNSENNAKEMFERIMGVEIQKCGVFIDEHLYFLTAQPDGLIGKDGIVEIKCPYNAKEIPPEDAIKNNMIKFVYYNENEDLILKRTSNIFYQIQGELHITKRQYCFLIIWTSKGIVYCRIDRDDNFWDDNMEKSLIDFYENIMLPEIKNHQLFENLNIADIEN